jgi:hypothetical protein
MAKKRKKGKEKEEEYEFIPPEFDEKEFIRKELRDSKALIVTVIYAILLGIVAGVISALNRSFVGLAFLVVIAGLFMLKFVYEFLRIDTHGFQKRNWVGNIATYFFTFLAIWILLLNTPFADFTNPVVSDVIVWVDDGTSVRGLQYNYEKSNNSYWWGNMNSSLPATIVVGSNQTINITAKVVDNGRLRTIEISIGIPTSTSWVDMEKSSVDNRWEHQVQVDDLESEFFIRTEDSSGNGITFELQKPLPITGSL